MSRLEKAMAFILRPAPVCPARTNRYPNFDILRLLLAAEVVFVHAWSTVDPNFGWNAYVMAVPAFLAISGFLVLQSYSESGSWGLFLKKRALRVLPALTVSLLLCLALFNWTAVYNSFLNWLTGGLYTIPGIANGPLWSLAWEELAYLALAGLWCSGAYKRPFWIWLLLIISVGVVWSGSRLTPHTRIILFLMPAFFTGNLMFLYRVQLLKVNPFIPWLVFYVMLRWKYVPDANWFGGASLLLVQAFAVVWAGMAGAKIIPFRFPDLSYGVYVYHMPIVLFLATKFRVNSLFEMLLWLAVTLVPFALASWYLIEKPALRLRRGAEAAPRFSVRWKRRLAG